jgi:hypothetical protein
MLPGNLENLVGPVYPQRLTSRALHRRGCGGFTLLEVQVAALIFVLAVFCMIGQARVYRTLLESVESEATLGGVAVVGEDRVVASVSRAGGGAAAPACEVSLHSLDDGGGTLEAEVVVERRSP